MGRTKTGRKPGGATKPGGAVTGLGGAGRELHGTATGLDWAGRAELDRTGGAATEQAELTTGTGSQAGTKQGDDKSAKSKRGRDKNFGTLTSARPHVLSAMEHDGREDKAEDTEHGADSTDG